MAKRSSGTGQDIYGFDNVDKDGSMAGDASSECLKTLGKLNRADVNGTSDGRAKADLDYPNG